MGGRSLQLIICSRVRMGGKTEINVGGPQQIAVNSNILAFLDYFQQGEAADGCAFRQDWVLFSFVYESHRAEVGEQGQRNEANLARSALKKKD